MSTEIIATADLKPIAKDSRVDLAWQVAEKWLRGIGVTVRKPDVDKIIAQMTKQKKSMAFVADWDGQWLVVRWVTGSFKEELSSIDMSFGKVYDKWREAMKLLSEKTQLVTAAQFAEWERTHANPKDVANYKAQLKRLNDQIKALNDSLVPLVKERDFIELRLKQWAR